MIAELERIKKKLHRLREADKDFEVFGSESHEYILDPPLSEEAISAYEQKNDLRLPEDYRLFLKEVGDGGAGPFYGLLPLEDNEDQSANMKEDFPFNVDAPCLLDKYAEYDDRIDNAATEEEADEIWEQKDALTNAEYERALKGVTFLCHEGCGMFNALILKGKDKGTVWWFNFADDVGAVPLRHPETKKWMRFLDWYAFWLDNSLDQIQKGKDSLNTYGALSSFTR